MLPQVELRSAKIPFVGFIAVHYWFVIITAETSERWEIWQSQNRGRISWGHLHQDLMPVSQGVGNGDSWIEKIWQAEEADKLINIIRESPQNYQYNYIYRYYPGPNSNTYVHWILQKAGINHRLSWKAIGKSYIKWVNFWA